MQLQFKFCCLLCAGSRLPFQKPTFAGRRGGAGGPESFCSLKFKGFEILLKGVIDCTKMFISVIKIQTWWNCEGTLADYIRTQNKGGGEVHSGDSARKSEFLSCGLYMQIQT